jgi:hypothetical protein
MSFQEILLRLCGYDDVTAVDEARLSWLATWAQGGWRFFGCIALILITCVFYARFQRRGLSRAWISLAAMRSLLLSIIFLILAEPVLTVTLVRNPKPLFWLLFDGTDSMAIQDRLPEKERAAIDDVVGRSASIGTADRDSTPSRMDYVRSLVSKDDGELLKRLAEKFRLRTFVFDRGDGARSIDLTNDDGEIDVSAFVEQLTTEGQVTALGSAMTDLRRRHSTGSLAGVLVVSDFDQNSGPSPIAAAARLEKPVHTLGVGPESAIDVGIDVQAPLVMKKAERATVIVGLRQSGLDGQTVRIRLIARPIEPDGVGAARTLAGDGSRDIVIDERDVILDRPTVTVDLPYTPDVTGRFSLVATVDPIEGEVVDQNNRFEREVHIRDDFLRLFFVEFEPTWEWRFIKEVFYRDKLVGMRGFRTFLRSADPKVRHAGGLFVPTLAPRRSEFFANDVIFLGDMPGTALTTRFADMCKEFVGNFGGGLVIISGSRFGPAQLSGTPLADMLPVIVDPRASHREDREFELELTPDAALVDFMRLGESEEENTRAWKNLGKIPWYQPVARLHPLGTALAVHPSDTCVDGETPQPLIAIRRYGKGEVVYVAFNETWRFRRRYGELYYRQFWGQMIHRLGLSHALGSQKRFVVRTDRQRYRADDEIIVTVEAYDSNFEPLDEDKLPGRSLMAHLVAPEDMGEALDDGDAVAIPQLREGVFETRMRVVTGGEHRIRVKDPENGEWVEVNVQVADLSPERRSAVRNTALEREIAVVSGGRNYDLTNVSRLVDEFEPERRKETRVEVFPIWNTWFAFGLVLFLMLGEWFLRKLVNLP